MSVSWVQEAVDSPRPVPRARLALEPYWAFLVRYPGRSLVIGVVVASLLRLIPLVLFQGTPDVPLQIRAGDMVLRGLHLYGDWGSDFGANETPLGYLTPALMLIIGRTLGVADYVSVKLPDVAADVAAALAIWFGAKRLLSDEKRMLAALLYLFNPVGFLMTAYHGNIDPVINVLMLGALLLALTSSEKWWLSALVLGCSATIKPAPLLFVPVFAVFYATWSRRIRYGLLAALPPLTASSYYALTDPGFKQILAYRSVYGNWGIPMVLQQSQNVVVQLLELSQSGLARTLESVNAFTRADGRYVLLAIMLTYFVLLAFSNRAQQAALPGNLVRLLLLFYVFASGFGVQYLSWIVPFLLLYSLRATALYSIVAGIFLAATYVQFTLPGKYGVVSITQHLRLLSPPDLVLLFGTATSGLVCWLVCAGLLARLFPIPVRKDWAFSR